MRIKIITPIKLVLLVPKIERDLYSIFPGFSFQTDLKKLDIVNSVAMRREEGNEKRFCCSVCAFAISKQDHMPIKCYLGQPTDIGIDIPMSNVTKKEDFVVSEFSTKRCVTLKVVPKATFSCSCKVSLIGVHARLISVQSRFIGDK